MRLSASLCTKCRWCIITVFKMSLVSLACVPLAQAYMVTDFCLFLLPYTPGDHLFIGHHIMTRHALGLTWHSMPWAQGVAQNSNSSFIIRLALHLKDCTLEEGFCPPSGFLNSPLLRALCVCVPMHAQ